MILLSDNKRLALVGAYDNREGHFGLDCSNAILNGKLLSTNIKHGYAYMVEDIYECIGIIKAWANEVDLGRNYTISDVRVPAEPKNIKKMLVRSRDGSRITPNGCWYYIEYVELVKVDIRTGKYIVKPLSQEELDKIYQGGHSLDLSGSYDMDYTNCIDTKKKPITLTWLY